MQILVLELCDLGLQDLYLLILGVLELRRAFVVRSAGGVLVAVPLFLDLPDLAEFLRVLLLWDLVTTRINTTVSWTTKWLGCDVLIVQHHPTSEVSRMVRLLIPEVHREFAPLSPPSYDFIRLQ